MKFSTFEEKLAYEIGVSLAYKEILTKEAMGGVAARLKGGIDAMRAGQSFSQGAGKSVGSLLGDAGRATGNAIVQPFRDAAGKLTKGRIGNEFARHGTWREIARKDGLGAAKRLAGAGAIGTAGTYLL